MGDTVPGAFRGYKADRRRYQMNTLAMVGDDEAAEASEFTLGGIMGMNVSGALTSDLAVMLYSRRQIDVAAGSPRDLADHPRGNALTWVCDRSGASGATGDGYLCLAHGANLNNRLHDPAVRTLSSSASIETYLSVGTLLEVEANAIQIPF